MSQMVISSSTELTERDFAVVEWVGRVGAATIDQVARRFGLSRTRAYVCAGRCVAMGLLERKPVLHRAPALLVATREGLLAAGLALPSARISAALARHHEACGSVAVWLAQRYPERSILSDREIRLEESGVGRAIASAKVGEFPNGAPRLHRPDFATIGDDVEAFEVELTPKAPQRLERLVRAWRRASHVAQVTYLCGSESTRSAVDRAIGRTRAEERVRVAWLSEVVE